MRLSMQAGCRMLWNEDPHSFIWTATADQMNGKIARYCRRISGPGR